MIESLKLRADKRRTTSERLADLLVTKIGSMTFLIINGTWFVSWIVVNSGIIPSIVFDPYPFGLLTTMVSLEAIALTVLVLISQNRESRVTDIREEVDFQLDVVNEREVTKILELVTRIARKHRVRVDEDENLREMLKPTDTSRIERIIEGQI